MCVCVCVPKEERNDRDTMCLAFANVIFYEWGIASLQKLTRPSYAQMHRAAALPPGEKPRLFKLCF